VAPNAEPGPRPATLDVTTPEGTVLPFVQAGLFDRLAALAIDQLLILVVTVLLLLLVIFVFVPTLGVHALSFFLFTNFVLRNAYFPFFEMRGGGSTPGKRMLRLRVISRDGGALQPEQVMVRNLTREFEMFIPLTVLSAPRALFPDLPPWAALLCSLWMLVGALFPVFQRRRLRLGDLLGGTTVVSMPRVELLRDLAGEPTPQSSIGRVEQDYAFSSVQLDQYGIDELQVLEDLLRDEGGVDREKTLTAVMRKIEAKIDWDGPTNDFRAQEFLSAFYRQLRRHLEQKALFGVRQQHKRTGRLRRGGRGSG